MSPAEPIEVSPVAWANAVRIVSSRFPPVGVFETVGDAVELEALYAVEAMTNERLAEEIGQLELVPTGDRLTGPGTTPIMAAFTHPRASRFSDGSFGVYYCAADELTARRETAYHRERFMAANRLPAMAIDMREYVGRLEGELHDLTGRRSIDTAIFDPDDYAAAQALGARLRAEGSNGVVYDSVRDPRGLACAAVFRPPLLGPVTQRRHLVYHWDGTRIARMQHVEDLEL